MYTPTTSFSFFNCSMTDQGSVTGILGMDISFPVPAPSSPNKDCVAAAFNSEILAEYRTIFSINVIPSLSVAKNCDL